MLIFGTARSYPQAIIGRFTGGFLSGNLGVMKSFLTEITDHSNRGKGFSYVSVSWALGCIIAPLIGGFLCSPASKYPSVFDEDSLFAEYPYLLPTSICAGCNIITSVLCMICMRETRNVNSSSQVNSSGCSSHSNTSSAFSKDSAEVEMVTKHSNSLLQVVRSLAPGARLSKGKAVKYSPVITNEDIDSTRHGGQSQFEIEIGSDGDDDHGEGEVSTDGEDANLDGSGKASSCNRDKQGLLGAQNSSASPDIESASETISASTKMTTSEVLRQPAVLYSCTNYGILAMAYILFDETIPLFLKLDLYSGGLGFTSAEIGFVISITGSIMLVFTFFCLPWFTKYSKQWMFELGIIGGAPMTFAWPLLALLNTHVLTQIHPTTVYYSILWPLLILIFVVKNIFSCLSFTAVMIQVNHSVSDEYLGAVNGFGQSCASLARAVGPAIGGALWSLSIQTQNVFLNFLGVMALLVVSGVINRQLPASLDHKLGDREHSLTETEREEEEEGNPIQMMH
jgi:MFS family permease